MVGFHPSWVFKSFFKPLLGECCVFKFAALSNCWRHGNTTWDKVLGMGKQPLVRYRLCFSFFFFFYLSLWYACMLRQSRGRHLNHCYHIVIQSQLPICNNFAHFLHVDDLFPCFWKFSGFGPVSMLDDGEPRMNTLPTVETFRFRDENCYIFNQGGKTKILSHLPKLFSKNPFFCFTVSWARKAVVV